MDRIEKRQLIEEKRESNTWNERQRLNREEKYYLVVEEDTVYEVDRECIERKRK